MRRFSFAGLAAVAVAAVVAPLLVVMACGPDWEPEVFVPEHHPEKPERFADGHLGVLQRGYYHADLVVAYRYLSGGTLTDDEKASYKAANDQSGGGYGNAAAELWRQARLQNGGQQQGYNDYIQQDRLFKKTVNGAEEVDFELNCPNAAFRTAIGTMQDRAGKWGTSSTDFNEWLRGQDAVFSNCSKAGSMPNAAKPEWPPLLRQDRAYQIAAAKFYSANYDGAIQDFEAIGKDSSSPWNVWGEYLAARAEIRKAASIAKPAGYNQMATFDHDEMIAARTRLIRVEKESRDTGIRDSAAGLLAFIEVRLEPAKRLDEVSAALASAKGEQNFPQDMADFNYLMDRRVSGSADLARWVEQFQAIVAPDQPLKPEQVVEEWRQKRTLPWLVAALTLNPGKAPQELLDAAAAVKLGSSGSETVAYLRAEQMLDGDRRQDARTLLTTLLNGTEAKATASTRNSLLAARMPTAATLNEFLADAPRTIIGDATSEAAAMVQCPGAGVFACKENTIQPLQFDTDAAAYMNLQMPLATLEQAAESTALPAHLRQAVAMAAWVRALGLGDAAAVRRMAKLLPAPMRQTAGDSDGFPATLALLRAPGVRPFLDQGVQRSVSYAELDHFRDNWWCGRWTDNTPRPGSQSYGAPRTVEPVLALLSATQRQRAADEAARLDALPAGLVWAAERAMEYVQAHPQDKDAPEALALIVHGTRYGCGEYSDPKPQSAVSKQAFEMLHRMYPKSPWTLKTKYYY